MRNKKKWILFLCILLVAALLLVIGFSNRKEVVYLEAPDPEFYPNGYHFVMHRFADSANGKKVKPVEDYKDAARKGLRLLRKENGEEWGRWNGWLWGNETITVFYVPEEDTWVWLGSCPCVIREDIPHWVGCHPVVIMQSDGTVLAIGSY